MNDVEFFNGIDEKFLAFWGNYDCPCSLFNNRNRLFRKEKRCGQLKRMMTVQQNGLH